MVSGIATDVGMSGNKASNSLTETETYANSTEKANGFVQNTPPPLLYTLVGIVTLPQSTNNFLGYKTVGLET